MSKKDFHPFFRNLKATTKGIHNDIKEIKAAMREPVLDNCVVIRKCEDLFVTARKYKREAYKLLDEIEPKIIHYRNYHYDVEDLVLEMDDEVINLEHYFHQYGYYHISREYPIIEYVPEPTPPDNDKTPILFTMTEVLRTREVERMCYSLNKSDFRAEKKEPELDVTPVLDLDETNVIHEDPKRGSTPLPQPPADLPKYGYHKEFADLARRLDFD